MRLDFAVDDAVRLLPGRIFFVGGGRAFLQGVCGKNGVSVWCFCGEVVVSCW
jgi:hypothetical protein